MDVCLLWVLCVLSGSGLCDELIARPEESYRLWRVVVCDLENSWLRRPWPHWGLSRQTQPKLTLQYYVILCFVRFKYMLAAVFTCAPPEYASCC